MNESGPKWTPELKIQAFKEGITALMGLAVVIFTLWIAYASLAYTANREQMSNAKDILLLVMGLTGVVIGYYFGRIPADARATQANQKADAATAGVAVAANAVDEIIAKQAAAGASGAVGKGLPDETDNAGQIEELRRVRDSLRVLAR